MAITLVSWHRSSNPKLQRHARFGNMDANAAFTPGSLPFTGAGVQAKLIQHDAARGLRNATPSCNSGLAPKGDWYLNDHATASVRRSGSTNIDLHIHEGSWPICQNGNNSALRGLGMLLGSLGEVHAGCAKPIATTKSWERAPARL